MATPLVSLCEPSEITPRHAHSSSAPSACTECLKKITINKGSANTAAVLIIQADNGLSIGMRQSKSFRCARILDAGIEAIHMFRKGQLGGFQDRASSAANQFYSLAFLSTLSSSSAWPYRAIATEPPKISAPPRSQSITGSRVPGEACGGKTLKLHWSSSGVPGLPPDSSGRPRFPGQALPVFEPSRMSGCAAARCGSRQYSMPIEEMREVIGACLTRARSNAVASAPVETSEPRSGTRPNINTNANANAFAL